MDIYLITVIVALVGLVFFLIVYNESEDESGDEIEDAKGILPTALDVDSPNINMNLGTGGSLTTGSLTVDGSTNTGDLSTPKLCVVDAGDMTQTCLTHTDVAFLKQLTNSPFRLVHNPSPEGKTDDTKYDGRLLYSSSVAKNTGTGSVMTKDVVPSGDLDYSTLWQISFNNTT